MFTLALAAAIAVAPPRPVLVDNPYACPVSTPWAIPSGSEAHPYECVAVDLGEQVADPAHMPKPTPPVSHHAAPAPHRAAHVSHHRVVKHHVVKHRARKAARR